MVSLEYFIDIILLATASNRNEYREYFLGGNGGRCVGLTTLPHVSTVLKSGTLNLLEASGPVQGCNGIALPLPYIPVILHVSYGAEIHVGNVSCYVPTNSV